ncbi:MAG: DUF1080 domain-containing protein [Planctomycetota bacterium]
MSEPKNPQIIMEFTMKYSFLCLLALITFATTASAQEGWVDLFNGQDFDGWQQAGGEAKYSVQDGVIIGESVPNTPNSFMCTQKLYHDFILEYEYKCDSSLNSGVQFRSNVYAIDIVGPASGKKKGRKIPAGRVHGYQCEIDPNKPDRMWASGVYDEARRGWLYPGQAGGDAAAFTAQGKKTFKDGDWNKVRIQCEGDHIQTWLNGEPRADFKDSLTSHGIIALQVHGIGKNQKAIGTKVMWKNLKIKEL